MGKTKKTKKQKRDALARDEKFKQLKKELAQEKKKNEELEKENERLKSPRQQQNLEAEAEILKEEVPVDMPDDSSDWQSQSWSLPIPKMLHEVAKRYRPKVNTLPTWIEEATEELLSYIRDNKINPPTPKEEKQKKAKKASVQINSNLGRRLEDCFRLERGDRTRVGEIVVAYALGGDLREWAKKQLSGA